MTSDVRAGKARTDRPAAVVAVLLTLGAMLTSFPFLWMIVTAFKPLGEAVQPPLAVLPEDWTLESFRTLFTELSFARYTMNTLGVVAYSFVGMFISAAAGYAFAKLPFRGKTPLLLLVLATMMVPVQVTMIPTFLILNELGLANTLLGISLPTMVVAFNVFLFRQFMLTVPDEVLEAARIDGAGELRTFVSVVMPMSKPILAVQAVLTFIGAWNAFLFPLILGRGEDQYTLSVGLALINQQQVQNPPLQLAGATLMVLPVVLLFVVCQRYIIQGFTLSGLK
jgi:multiple sugar transport system permease protein